MRTIRLKKVKINWKNFLNYTLLILLSSCLLLDVLIALPLTEKLTNIVAFDLNVAKEFWSKEYLLDLESEDSKDIEKTRNVLFKRLNDYGVEEVSVIKEDGNLRVIVNTSLSQTYVEELIRNPYQYSIVTRKEGVDFENEEDPYAQYMPTNYDETEFDSSIFRNIYITLLPDTSGTESYFGIGKIWPNKAGAFTDFLNQYNQKYIGINIDGFVTPLYISDSKVFAIPLGSNSGNIRVIDLLYNSGDMPTQFTLQDESDISSSTLNIDYIEISIAIFILILAIYIYLLFTKQYSKKLLSTSLFATIVGISTLLTLLKIGNLPINMILLLIEAMFIIILTRVIITNPESRYTITISAFLISLIFNFLGIGYLRIFANDMMTVSLLVLFSVIFSNYYINNMSEYFKK